MSKVINNISDKEIIKKGQLVRNIHCEQCDYETGIMYLKDGIFKVNMEGGYFMYNDENESITKCPLCKKDKLSIVD